MENDNIKHRLVGYIMPKTSWGFKEDEHEMERIASVNEQDHEQYGICFVQLCRRRDNKDKWMVSIDNPAVPVGEKLVHWSLYQINLEEAMNHPVMHKEDFE